MSVPNVFLSRLEPLGKVDTMESITKEVKIMMDPDQAFSTPADSGAGAEEEVPERFGIMDVEDVSWKNYFDSLACTECGRCTAVCPANITGKLLSPRKIVMDVRARMKEKGPGLVKNGKESYGLVPCVMPVRRSAPLILIILRLFWECGASWLWKSPQHLEN